MKRLSMLFAAFILVFSGPAKAQKFAAFGDFGNRAGAAPVAALVVREQPQDILGLGDQCYGRVAYASQLKKYSDWTTTNRFWPTLGNHEFSDPCGGGAASAYYAYHTLPGPGHERYYDVVLGNVHVFSINSNARAKGKNRREPDGIGATQKQAMWLKANLAASTTPWKIVIMHHPPHSSGHHGPKITMQWPYEQWGAHAVLAGHEHSYERLLIDSNKDGKLMPYFVSGLGGAEQRAFRDIRPGSIKRYNAGFGVLLFNATATTLDFRFKNTAGEVIDTYAMRK